MRDQFVEAAKSADDLRKFVASLPWNRKITVAEANKAVDLIKETNTFLSLAFEAADEKPMTADEELAAIDAEIVVLSNRLIFDAPTLGTATGPTAQGAKLLAKVLDDRFADVIKRGQLTGKDLERFNFYRGRCATVMDYPGQPSDPSPNWSVLVQSPFWQYPPLASGFPWWLLIAAGAAYYYTKRG